MVPAYKSQPWSSQGVGGEGPQGNVAESVSLVDLESPLSSDRWLQGPRENVLLGWVVQECQDTADSYMKKDFRIFSYGIGPIFH